MKFRIASDLHIDYSNDNFVLSEGEDEKSTVLLLAGDVASQDVSWVLRKFLENACSRFQSVVFVPGNHCYCGGSWKKANSLFMDLYISIENLYVLQSGHLTLEEGDDKYILFGATLWTDFNRENPIDMLKAGRCMIEYHQIPDFTPEDAVKEHKFALEELRKTFEDPRFLDHKRIVVTHHAPSFWSVDDRYHNSDLNSAYYSDLEWVMEEFKPLLWVHGHMHMMKDYVRCGTRVVINPRGYHNKKRQVSEETGFIENLVIEV